MTMDEVIALPDELLQVKTAELAGWVCVGSDDPCSAAWMSHPWVNPRGTACREIPDYMNDPAAAWSLVEKAGLSILRVDDEWWVGKFNGTNGDWWFDLGPLRDVNALRAITRAFVLVMDNMEERQ